MAERGTHFSALDSLRGIAAVIVVLHHIEWGSLISTNPLITNGYLMVDFFFVLSGFVIALNYSGRLRDGGLGRFIWLRFWRLYPLHLLMLFVFVGIEVAKWFAQTRLGIAAGEPAFSQSNGQAFALQLFLLQGFTQPTGLTFNGAAWSISVEFYAYLLFAVIAVFFRGTVAIAATLSLIGIGLVLTTDLDFAGKCLYGFFLGCILFRLMPRYELRGLFAELFPAAALTALAGLIASASYEVAAVFAPPLSALVIAAIVSCPNSLVTRALRVGPLLLLGSISYSVYMVHGAVLWLFNQGLFLYPASISPMSGTILAAVAVTVTLALASGTYRWVEEPWRRWSKTYPLARFGLSPEKRVH